MKPHSDANESPAVPQWRNTPSTLTSVVFTDGFWAEKQRINREATIPAVYSASDDRIENLRLKWTPDSDLPSPHLFWDSDVAKWVEAASHSLATHPDDALAAQVREVVELCASAQEDDGYLNSFYQITKSEEDRWTDLCVDHELYSAGHLFEAAVAHHRATAEKVLLDVACRLADHIDRHFGPDQERGYPGHEEIELALIKLWQATGEERYLKLSSFFVDERGQTPNYFDVEKARRDGKEQKLPFDMLKYSYTQAHMPVREQVDADGHSVRALYLYAGMIDLAAATGDAELLAACRRLWESVTERRMYITGGVGSSHHGERFTFDYDLPNEEAYAETCASIALVFFAQRLLRTELRGCYGDVMERALYNGVMSGVSLSGDAFFYPNPLAAHPPRHETTDLWSPERQTWFDCACCPSNLARLLASFGEYLYAQGDRELCVHLYAASAWSTEVNGTPVRVEQRTNYPWEETVEISVEPDAPVTFSLALRIPGWCDAPGLTINGEAMDADSITTDGYARLERTWQKGDVVTLTLPMPVKRIAAHPNVRHDRGRVALQRGPVVYCLEAADNGVDLSRIVLPDDAELSAAWEADMLGGVVTISGTARREQITDGKLYRPLAEEKTEPCEIKAVPYHAWANRGPGEMLVWIRRG